MKRTIILALCLLLGGCSTMKGSFENRAACTTDNKPWILSKWGLFAFAFELAEGDAKVCEPRK